MNNGISGIIEEGLANLFGSFLYEKVFYSNFFSDLETAENISDKLLEFREFLTNEVIKVSGLYKYEDLFKKISGEDFSLKYMID